MLTLAPDGLVRLSFNELCSLRLHPCMIWSDDDLRMELSESGIELVDAGYCEWASEMGVPQVSIGWAWYQGEPGQGMALAPGGISSNVMLRSQTGYDLGTGRTEELLQDWLAQLSWQEHLSHPVSAALRWQSTVAQARWACH